MKRSITYMAMAMSVFLPCLSKVALAGTISTSKWAAETNAAPALANFNGSVFAAWKGYKANRIWYAVGPDWTTQQTVPEALTTEAPALAATSSTLYLAWRGQSTSATDHIYYSTNTGSGFAAQQKVCDGLGTCAETTASPAIAAASSTVYVAWTTASDTIQLATYAGSGDWSLATTSVPGATTTTAPALAVSGDELYLAWVEEGTSNLMYATLPLSGGSWSPVSQVKGTDWTAQTSVAPAFGVSPVPEHTGLYLGWTEETSPGVFTVNLSQFAGSAFNPPIPIPPGPLVVADMAPALAGYIGGSTNCGFSSVYSFYLAFTTAGDEIGFSAVQSDTVFHKCPPCNKCP